MKKIWMIAAAAVLLLAGCAAPAAQEGQPAQASAEDGGLKLTVFVEKDAVAEGEAVVCYAEIENTGSENAVLLHSDPLVVFPVTGGPLTGDYAVEDSLNRTELAPGEVKRFDFQKSGGYSEDDPDADFLRGYYAEPELILQPGSYEIAALAMFSTDEDEMVGTQQELKAALTVTVGP